MDTSIRITEGDKKLNLVLKGDRAVFKMNGGELTVRIEELITIFKIHLQRIKREQAEEIESILGE